MRTFLIVANQTAGSPSLRDELEKRIAAGPVSMHVVVPATGAKDLVRLAALSSDPLSGFPVALADVAGANEAANEHAAEQLGEQLRQLRQLGVEATGEVGDADPMLAIAAAIFATALNAGSTANAGDTWADAVIEAMKAEQNPAPRRGVRVASLSNDSDAATAPARVKRQASIA